MENNNEIIINNNTESIKVKKPKSEALKEAQKNITKKSNQTLITWNAPEYQVKSIMIATKKKY